MVQSGICTFIIYAVFTGTAVHSSPVWMDARPLCDCGVCRMMFACDTFCTVQFHTLTYRIFFPCYWPSAPVEGGRIETQALVMNGLRSPLNGGVSKLKPYLFRIPVQWELPPPGPPVGSSKSFPGDFIYFYILLCSGP